MQLGACDPDPGIDEPSRDQALRSINHTVPSVIHNRVSINIKRHFWNGVGEMKANIF